MRNFKLFSATFSQQLGNELRSARIARKQTLKEVSERIGVDVGQLSRFERGEFKTGSTNLQKYAKYLQKSLTTLPDPLEERFRRFAERSGNHRQACEMLLEALERLG